MIRKDLVPSLTEIQKRRLTRTNIARAILLIMKDHIGRDNGLSREDLYFELFKERDINDLKSELRWLYVGRAFNFLRKYTKCFCTAIRIGTTFHYFVIQNEEDAEVYQNILEKNIKAMRTMQRLSHKAAINEWYKEEWYLPGEKPETITAGQKLKKIFFKGKKKK